jgi:hypothetical protein
MKNDLTKILAICLDALESKEHTLDELLSLYPEYREELKNLLPIAITLRKSDPVTARPEFAQLSPARMQKRLVPHSQNGLVYFFQQTVAGVSRKIALASLIVILMITGSLASAGTLVYASGNAIPGDFLYPVKLAAEDTRLWIADDDMEMTIRIELLKIRVDEIDQLIESKREEDLNLSLSGYAKIIDDITKPISNAGKKSGSTPNTQTILLEEALTTQTERINSLLGTAPEEAKPALQQVMEKSNKALEMVQELLSKEKPGENNDHASPVKENLDKSHGPGDANTDYQSDSPLQSTPTPDEQNPESDRMDKRKTPGIPAGPPDWVRTKNPHIPNNKP